VLHKTKKDNFKFTFQTFLRLLLFFVFFYFLVSYLSTAKPKLTIDPTLSFDETANIQTPIYIQNTFYSLYGLIPEKSRQTLENLNQNSVIINLQNQLAYLKGQTNGFPQKQITDIEKMIVKNVYDNMIKNIENKNGSN
jgi:hypothetical protein